MEREGGDIMQVEVHKVKISDIKIDESIYPRTGTWWQKVQEYRRKIEAGIVLPPITLGTLPKKKTLWLVDGRHRLEANIRLKNETIDATFQEFPDKKTMFVEAVRSNSTHGFPFSMNDKRLLDERLKKYEVDDLKISVLLGIPISRLEILRESQHKSAVQDAMKRQRFTEHDIETVNREIDETHINVPSVKNAIQQTLEFFKNNLVSIDDPEIREMCIELNELIISLLKEAGV
jgi:ParB-like chromosome segregation protein Spo0J